MTQQAESPNTQMEPWGHSRPWRLRASEQIWIFHDWYESIHRCGLPRQPENKYEKALHKVSQANKVRNRIHRLESIFEVVCEQLLVATGSGVWQPSSTWKHCLLHRMPSLFYPLPSAEIMFLVFICSPQILGLCFTRRFTSLQRICQYGSAYRAVLPLGNL